MSEPRYCSLLWAHMSNEPLGQVRTCCIAKERVKDDNGEDFTLGSTSVRDIFHSNYYKKIRQEIREGKLPENCEPCWREEANGKKSKRQIYNEYAEWRLDPIDYSVEPDMPQDMQIILSTTCNLKCRSCNPNYSSKWVKEAEDRNLPYVQEKVAVKVNDQQSFFWSKMNDWLPHVRFLEVMGGEPLYMKEFKQFAEKLIDDNIAKDVEITFSTNGTTLNKKFMEKMINNFKSIGFNVSIDAAVQKRFEYLRHGADWKEVVDNLDYFHNLVEERGLSIGITITVTVFNVMYLAELHKAFEERWPKFLLFHNIANFPTWFNSNIFPEEAKPEILEPIKDLTQFREEYRDEIQGIIHHVMMPRNETVIPYGDSGEDTIDAEIEKRWFMFCKEIVAGDLYRKELFGDCFPELFTILVKHKSFNYRNIEYNVVNFPDYGKFDKGGLI